MPTKTVMLQLPPKSASGAVSPAVSTYQSIGAISPFGFTNIQTSMGTKNLKDATTITTTNIPTPRSRGNSENKELSISPGLPIARRSSTLRKKRRVKALSVGHISPTSIIGIRPGHERSTSSSSESSVDSADEAKLEQAHSVLQPVPPTGGVPQKASYMSRVANGLGFTSKSGAGAEEKREGKEQGPANSQLKTLGLGLGAGILFGTGGQQQNGNGVRSRSKSNVGNASSRPGTAGGLISTAAAAAAGGNSGKNSLSTLDVYKPLPSRPVSREGDQQKSYSRDVSTPTPFGAPGYSLLFVDHETIIPPRSNSKTRPRSISSGSILAAPVSRAPSAMTMRLEPILPVHVLDQMVSSPQEMSPATVSSVVQQYSTLNSQSRPETPQMTLLQRRESSRRRQRQLGLREDSTGISTAAENFVQSGNPVQDAEAVIRARSLSRSRSTSSNMRSFSRRPSANSSLRRQLRPSSPPSFDAGDNSRPGTSGSISVKRRDSSRSSIKHKTSEEIVDDEEERRGRGRTVAKDGVTGFRSARMLLRKEQQARDEQQSAEFVSARDQLRVQKEDQENSRAEKKDLAKRIVTPLARKPVPTASPRTRKPSRSSSRSRSRSNSSRPPSPEKILSPNTMDTIAESHITKRIKQRAATSRTPSPLREAVSSTSASVENTGTLSRSSSVDAHRLSRVGLIAEIQAPTAQQRALLAAHSTTGSSNSLRARFRAEEGMGIDKPSGIPVLAAVTGVPKRKPVPQTVHNLDPSLLSIHSPTQLGLLPRPRNTMIVAIPPPLYFKGTATESPVSGGGGAGLMSSEDEEDNSKTPMTATFNFVTPLLPSPPKKPVPVSISPASTTSTIINTESNNPNSGTRKSDIPIVIPSVVIEEQLQSNPTSQRQSIIISPSFPAVQNGEVIRRKPEPEKTVVQNDVHDETKIYTATAMKTQIPEIARNRPAPISTSSAPLPIQKHDPSPETEPHPISPVSPIGSSPEIDDPTQRFRDSAQLLEIERKEMHAERSRWAEERQKMQSRLDTIQLENDNLREMVYLLTERVERQDLELRNQQQAQRQLLRTQSHLPKPLTLQPGAAGVAASGKIPQHGWSVFTNPRTPPPAPNGKHQIPEISQVINSADIKQGVPPKPTSHRRASVSMYLSPTSPSNPTSLLQPPTSMPKQIPVLRKGLSSSLPSMGSNNTSESKSNIISPTAQVGPSLSTSVPSGSEDDGRKRGTSPASPALMSKIPKLGGEKQIVSPEGVAGASSGAMGRSPKALWKRTAAVAVGRKGKVST